MKVTNWPFESIRNSLAISVSSSSTDTSQQIVPSVDSNGNLKWMTITVCDISLYQTRIYYFAYYALMSWRYSTYLKYGLLDGMVQEIKFEINDTDKTKSRVIMPHFWNTSGMLTKLMKATIIYIINAEIDPNFMVLQDFMHNGCAPKISSRIHSFIIF